MKSRYTVDEMLSEFFFLLQRFFVFIFKVLFSTGSSAAAQSDSTVSKDAGIEPRTVAS